MGHPRSSILFLGVSYHSDADARTIVSDILTQQGVGNFSVIIVDNSSPSKLTQVMQDVLAENLNLSILIPQRNLGYYGAASWALGTCCFRRSLPEWTIVSNVDVAIGQKDFFRRLIE